MKKVNVAELLKDCPTGMELDSPVWDNIVFEELDDDTIIISRKHCSSKVYLSRYGDLNDIDGKCIIFPKGKTTWEGFVPPCKFKDGDIVAHQNHMGTWIGIYHKHDYLNETFSSYCCIGRDGKFWAYFNNDHGYDKTRLATKEEKQKLFDAIKANGYKWNAETKTLEKLVEPKFKVGDKVRRIHTGEAYIIGSINSNGYMYKNEGGVGFTFEDEGLYELVPEKFDISTLIPFESRVLARYCKDSKWIPTFWGSYDKEDPENPYNCCGMLFAQCIPYEGNEYLLGKTEDCIDFYKTWER
jgi:hypothetical protein